MATTTEMLITMLALFGIAAGVCMPLNLVLIARGSIPNAHSIISASDLVQVVFMRGKNPTR